MSFAIQHTQTGEYRADPRYSRHDYTTNPREIRIYDTYADALRECRQGEKPVRMS